MKKFLIVFSLIILSIAVCVIFITANLRPTTPSLDSNANQAVVTPDSTVIVESVRQLARLETVSMFFQRQFSAERNQELWGLFGERLLFDAYGEVVAGVDLSKITTNDIEIIDDKTIRISLPPAEVFQVVLDNERSWIVYRIVGPFTQSDSQMESQVRLEAQQNLLDCAHESGIILMAELKAQDYIRKLMHQLGFVAVKFSSK